LPKKKLNGFWKCIELGSGVFNARYVPVAVRRLAVEMGHWTGDDIESPRDFYITFFIVFRISLQIYVNIHYKMIF